MSGAITSNIHPAVVCSHCCAQVEDHHGGRHLLGHTSLVQFQFGRNIKLQFFSAKRLPLPVNGRGILHIRSSATALSAKLKLSHLSCSERALSCCETDRKLKVAVLLSGGVDSSVALKLLCASGHSCTAFYLKIWFQDDFTNFWSSCPWEEDLKYAQQVCLEAGVELKIIHLTDEYWEKVVSECISKIHAGLTPNPDILCNSRIKFGVFLKHLDVAGFDRVASGHYARVERCYEDGKALFCLKLSMDEVKDQTYFLSNLSSEQLSKLMFPLGCLTKAEVRELAQAMSLSNKDRKDSQGICFLGKVRFSEFIAQHLGEKEGLLMEAETGKLLGKHKGFWFYTIGQRQGLGLSNGPWYVVGKDVANNVIFISRSYFSGDKQRREFEVTDMSWFTGSPPKNVGQLRCKVRHGPNFYNCSISFQGTIGDIEAGIANIATVALAEDDQGLAAGQFAAFYKGDVCLGSGIIAYNNRLDLLGVSTQALEAAKLHHSDSIFGLAMC